MDEKKITLSESDLKRLMKEAVCETLSGLGIDTRNPLSVQRDLQYLRDWRHTTESIRGKAILVAVSVTVAGFCGVFWLGIKAILNRC
jgi:hypothetical protein